MKDEMTLQFEQSVDSFNNLMEMLLDGFIEQDKDVDLTYSISVWSELPEFIKKMALDRDICREYFELGIFKDEDNWEVEEYLNYLVELNESINN